VSIILRWTSIIVFSLLDLHHCGGFITRGGDQRERRNNTIDNSNVNHHHTRGRFLYGRVGVKRRRRTRTRIRTR